MTLHAGPRSSRGRWAVVLVATGLLVTGCGGGSESGSGTPTRTGGILPSATRSLTPPTVSETGVLPTRTRTVEPPTAEPTTQPPSQPPTQATTQPTRTRTVEPPTDPPTTELTQPTTQQPTTATVTTTSTRVQTSTQTRTPSAQPTSTGTAATTSAATSPTSSSTGTAASDVPSWVWLLIAALVLGAAISIPLIVRSERRKAWRADLAGAEEEVAWLARALVPNLAQAGSLDQVAAGWAAASGRVSALADRLTSLESAARDDEGRARARNLHHAVTSSRDEVQQLLVSGSPDSLPRILGLVSSQLESALAPPPAAPPA
jgi:hypothetical protein